MLGSGPRVAMETRDVFTGCAECLSKQTLLLMISENNAHSEVPGVLISILVPRHKH